MGGKVVKKQKSPASSRISTEKLFDLLEEGQALEDKILTLRARLMQLQDSRPAGVKGS